jgi:hypothetical protein
VIWSSLHYFGASVVFAGLKVIKRARLDQRLRSSRSDFHPGLNGARSVFFVDRLVLARLGITVFVIFSESFFGRFFSMTELS